MTDTIVDELPDEESNDFSCGRFLKWFHLIVCKHTRRSFQDEYLMHYFSVNKQGQSEKEVKELSKLKDDAVCFSNTLRTRWQNFFRKLWNDPIIQELLNDEVPQATKVDGCENGFIYIVETITENIFQKVFYGCSSLPPIQIHDNRTGNTTLFEDLKLMSKAGKKEFMIK